MTRRNMRYAFRQSVLSWADKNYSIEQWLKDRSITEARRAALQSFIQSVPESGDIGIVIIDENGDAAACERSPCRRQAAKHYRPRRSCY